MDGLVGVKLRVEGGHQHIGLAGGDDTAVYPRQDLDGGRRRLDIGGPNEGHGDGAEAGEIRLGEEAPQLAAVAVAHGGDVHQGEVALGVVGDTLGQEQQAGAGPENREAVAQQPPERFKKLQVPQEFALDGALAPGDNQAVQGAGEIPALADLAGGDAQGGQGLLVLGEGPLESQNSDTHSIGPAPP